MLKLYDYFRSSAAFRVRIALQLKSLSCETIPIHLAEGIQFSEQYQKKNPQQLVPALEDGNKIITQSLAIIEYLEEKFPNPALLPKNIYEKAIARSIALQIAADIHPLNNLRVLKYLTGTLKISEEQKNQWYQHWIHTGLSALEKNIVSYQLAGDYCIGDSPTIADIFLVPQLVNARRFSCDLSNYPTLTRIDAFCQSHPAFIHAWPKETV